MRLFAFVVLLFLGCSYKSTTISLPAKKPPSNITIHSIPFEGYILDKEKKIPIKLSSSFATLITSFLKDTKNYHITININRLQILYWADRGKLFVKANLFVKLTKKGVLKQKSIRIVRIANATRFTFKKKLKSMLLDAAKEVAAIIKELL